MLITLWARPGEGEGKGEKVTTKVTRTTCRLCLVRCGMLVTTDDGEVVRIVGDPDHPLSKSWLCAKGKFSAEYVRSPMRVRHPLKRVGERGGGRFEQVSWDDALGDIAGRLNRIVEESGPESVAVEALPPKEFFAYDIFCDVVGSTFFKHDAHNCFTPQLIADTLTYGDLLTYPGFLTVTESDVLLLWGVNLHETGGSKEQRVRDATRRGTKTIVVDPRPTRAASQADLWLRVRPGTDAALALGLLHEMIRNDWYDAQFVADWVEGFPALAERAAQYPPERVAAITWVDRRDIEEAARMFGAARTAAMYTFIGATMGGNAVSTLRLMGFLPALKGVDTVGNNRFLLPPKMRMASYYRYDKTSESPPGAGARRRYLSADRFPLLDGPSALTTPYPHPRQVIDAMLTGEPFPVRALWTDCNPLVSLEGSRTVMAALGKLDLLVVSDIVMSPTAYLADYVLPITTHLESDAVTEYSGLNMVAARARAIAPVGEAREEGEIVLDVLKRMGYGDKLPVQTYHEYLDHRLEPMGVTFEQLKQVGSIVTPDSERKYLTGRQRRDGRPGFNTPTGKVELVSRTLAAHGYDALPDFVEPPMSPFSTPELAAEYPLILISGTRSLEYYSTLGIEIAKLRKRRPDPSIEMAPETAQALGLEEGVWVLVESPSGPHGIRRKVAILEGMHPQVVNAEGLWYMPGEQNLAEAAMSVGANVLTELRDDVDPIIGGSTARCILCRLTPIRDAGPHAGQG